MPTIGVDGVSLYYEKVGQGEPLVFSHGVPTDYRAWAAQVETLSKTYSTYSYSRRYAYPNNREGDLSESTIEANAGDLKGLIEKLGIAPVHLVGHSYGGFTAAYLASQSPELIRSLVLVEPAIATLLVEDPNSSGQLFSLLIAHPGIALSARRFQSGSLGPSLKALDARQLEKAVKLCIDGIQNRVGAFAEVTRPVQQMMIDNAMTIAELRTRLPPFKADARRIARKTLVVNGKESAIWLQRIGELASKTIPHASWVTISSSRHFPHLENPSEFNSEVLRFLGRR